MEPYLSELTQEDAVVLEGGKTHSSVVKVGSTVRRPTGPWTIGVHALLRHLEVRGWRGAPRVLGIDSQGREVLTYVTGEVVWPHHIDLVGTDDALASVGRHVRTYHDVAQDFNPRGFAWSNRGCDPSGVADVMCHNDLAAWNLVLSIDGWVFIDWDLAAPGRRAWDIAWALLSLVPFRPDSGLDDECVARRIRVFCEGYGIDDVPRDVVHVARERSAHEADRIRTLGAAGKQPYDRLLAEGHYDVWSLLETHISRRAQEWTAKAFGVC
jgi:hypothetical protein